MFPHTCLSISFSPEQSGPGGPDFTTPVILYLDSNLSMSQNRLCLDLTRASQKCPVYQKFPCEWSGWHQDSGAGGATAGLLGMEAAAMTPPPLPPSPPYLPPLLPFLLFLLWVLPFLLSSCYPFSPFSAPSSSSFRGLCSSNGQVLYLCAWTTCAGGWRAGSGKVPGHHW